VAQRLVRRFALTVQNLTHPSRRFKGAGLGAADSPGTWRRGRGWHVSILAIWGGSARGLLDIDDTVREIIYGTITQLHRYLRNFASFRVAAIEGNNWLDYSRRSLAVVQCLVCKPLSET